MDKINEVIDNRLIFIFLITAAMGDNNYFETPAVNTMNCLEYIL